MSYSFIRGNTPLSDEAIRRIAPSVFSDSASEKTSKKYTFIPTSAVVAAMRKNGFLPVSVSQSRTRIEGNQFFIKHILRFRQADLCRNVGDVFPEICLMNSHNGISAYKMMLALHRLACSNGMVVSIGDMDRISVRHQGDVVQKVLTSSFKMVEKFPRIIESIEEMKAVKLEQEERIAFAKSALLIRWDEGKAPITPEALLAPRRGMDQGDSVWKTLNVVQEKLLNGGDRGRSFTGRKMTTRAVTSIDEDVRINRAVWALAERMKAIKTGRADAAEMIA